MKYRLGIVLLMGLNPQWGFASVSKEVKSARKNQLSVFSGRMNELNLCGEDVKAVSSKISIFREKLQTDSCQSVDSIDQLEKCVEFQKFSVDRIKSLVQETAQVQGRCSVFNGQNLLHELFQLQNRMESDLTRLKSKQEWAVKDEIFQKNLFKESNYTKCNFQTHSKLRYALDWKLHTNMSTLIGDVYGFQEGLSALRVLNSYISTQANICRQYMKEAHDEHSKKNLEGMEKTVKQSREILDQALAQSQEVNTDQWTQKICSELREREHESELCENPNGNPSWIYSIHNLYEEVVFKDL